MKRLGLVVLVGLVLAYGQVWACTGLVVTDGDRVLVGNNEDYHNPRAKIWFIQPAKDRYGSIAFGFDDLRSQGGMNQKGLFFDAFALKPKEVQGQEGKARFKGALIKEVMATCATVPEALELLNKYNRSFMSGYQTFLADANGDSAIVESDTIIRKTGDFQVVTNFRQSEISPADISCSRYLIAREMLENRKDVNVPMVRRILAATHQEGGAATLYSNIYDLKARKVHVYYFHNFQEEVVIDLEKELLDKTGVLDLPNQFPPNHAARAFVARYTNLKKEYIHTSPRFVFRYPDSYETGTPLDESQVFLAKNRYGQIPVLTASVFEAAPEMELSQTVGGLYAQELRKFGTDVRLISSEPTKLADGTAAYETRITWRLPDRMRLNTLVVSTLREGKIINVALHNTGELDYLKHIPYSLNLH
jgi:hypothetical protein